MITAPWSDEQVERLNAWQTRGDVHPFTCPEGHDLRATTGGWVCGHCAYTQNWAHPFMVSTLK